jgi:hypothetical protein
LALRGSSPHCSNWPLADIWCAIVATTETSIEGGHLYCSRQGQVAVQMKMLVPPKVARRVNGHSDLKAHRFAVFLRAAERPGLGYQAGILYEPGNVRHHRLNDGLSRELSAKRALAALICRRHIPL